MQVPVPNRETRQIIDANSSTPNLNFNPFSLTAFPAIRHKKVKIIEIIAVKILFSKVIKIVL